MSTMRQNVAFSDATAAAQQWRLVHGQCAAAVSAHYAAEVSSASAGSGGGSCAADSQTTAAVRTARSRATPAPTPVAIAQLKASTKGALRSAATFGGVDPRSVLQRTSKSRCVASAATDPTPTLTPFQPYFLTICTLGSYPDHIGPHQKRTSRRSRRGHRHPLGCVGNRAQTWCGPHHADGSVLTPSNLPDKVHA
jgi:hypothetical protein